MTADEQALAKDCIDPGKLRDALGRFATGVSVVTTRGPDGKLEGLTANSFAAVSLDPPLVLWSLNRRSTALSSFQNSGFFAVNVLSASQVDLSHHFAMSRANKYDGVSLEVGLGGCPLLQHSLATFECETERKIDGGDHVIFVGRVHRLTSRKGEPLIFSAGQYCTSLPLREGQAESDLDEIWHGLG
jgi:flavin reductase (DIM6/NTAB) family NADH-FMN oxidoreductase RutF